MTGLTLITRALRTAGVLGAEETPSGAQGPDALAHLNGMLDGWRADRLAVACLSRTAFAAVGGTQTYTLGPTGTWVYPSVPTWIDHATVVLSTSPDVESRLELLTPQRYESLDLKTLRSSPVWGLYYARTAPAGTVTLLPLPDVAQTIVLYLLAPLETFATVDTDVSLPSGYEDALTYNLAKRLTLEYGRPLNPTLAEFAGTTLALLKSANVMPAELTTDRALWADQGLSWSRADFLRGY